MPRLKKKKAGKTALNSINPSLPPAETVSGLGDRRMAVGICIFLSAIVWLVFGQTVHFEFVNYDDGLFVYENPAVIGGLSWSAVKWAFSHNVAANWHPLTMLSHMLDCQLYGLNAGGHHLTNVLLHTISAILLFLVLQQMSGKLWRSAVVAAIFAIHPLRVESVAWVAERKDVLSGLFFMLTLLAYVRYARGPFSLARYLCVVAMFVLGLLSKPMLVTLPFVLLLLDYWPLRRFELSTPGAVFRALRPLILEKIPLFILAAVLSIVTFFAQANYWQGLEAAPLGTRVLNALASYGIYMWEMIWPRNLLPFYPFTSAVPVWEVALAGVLLLTTTVLAIRVARRSGYVLVGWLWYLGMLVPTIGLVQVGSQSHADRYTYLPQIGLYVLLVWLAADWSVRWRHHRMILSGVSTFILIGLIFNARAQTSYWQNSVSLWTHTLLRASGSAVAQNNLGNALLAMGRGDEATVHFRKALQIDPHFAKAYYNLGNYSLQRGRQEEAMVYFQQALQVNPRYADAHNNLGVALLNMGRHEEAVVQFQKALEINPDNTGVHNNLSSALLALGRWDEAVAHYQKALQINPDDANTHLNFAHALLQMQRENDALVHYERANQINPRSWTIQMDLAWMLATASSAAVRDGGRAVALAEQANQTSGGVNSAVLCILAAAYAEAGRFDDAVRSAQKARALAQAAGQSDLVERLDRHLILYTAKQPVHQESKRFEN